MNEPSSEVTAAPAAGRAGHDLPGSDLAFRVERHGVDFIPIAERWASPRDVGLMWAGASVQIEYFVYGAILMTFGFSFWQAVSCIVLGNLSYLLVGLCSLQGPQAGTTVFGINRASFGPNGSRLIALFNWLTLLGFEVEGLILIVGAALALSSKAGFSPGTPARVGFVLLAVAIQAVLPFLGHATILRTLRVLILPFAVLFAVLVGFAAAHASLGAVRHGADWQVYLEGLAFTIALSGLGWTECGNDYSRYCPPAASPFGIVGWVLLGTALPQILIMTLGAAVSTFVKGLGTGTGGFLPLAHTHAIPGWLVTVFLLFSVAQLFAINSLDLYSSGVTLQALGVPLRRYQAVLLDCVLALAATLYAIVNLSFNKFLTDFVDLVIVWIAPWCAVYLVDWAMRGRRYVPLELQRTRSGGLYWRNGGVHWAGVVAQLAGMFASLSGLSATFQLPRWLDLVTVHTRDASGYGADLSIFLGMGVAAACYLLLGRRSVRHQRACQDAVLGAAR